MAEDALGTKLRLVKIQGRTCQYILVMVMGLSTRHDASKTKTAISSIMEEKKFDGHR